VQNPEPRENPVRVPTVRTGNGDEELQVVYQPIVEARTGRLFAYEALARSVDPRRESPPTIFAEAVRADRCGALGRTLRTLAVEHAPGIPLFLNIHPNEFDEGYLVRPDDALFRHEGTVYLEITESVPLTHFELCHSVLAEIRDKGIHLAIDDLGAGYSNLKYIADLSPDVVKLDRELIAGVRRGTRQHTLLRSIVNLCSDFGAQVVAEGIETEEEFWTVQESGAHYAQGYYIARPAFPAPKVRWP
jgi:EAL domain-containing protein (putative c-di-GMP-specific phosphodiesterase class I)